MSRSSNRKPIGITLGDPAGIGAEVTARALAPYSPGGAFTGLAKPLLHRAARFTIIGDACLFRRYFPVRYKNCTFLDVGCLRAGDFRMGRPGPLTGKASLAYLHTAVELLKRGHLSALVTAPVCKEAIGVTVPSFHGHTEFLAGAFGAKDIGMMFVGGRLRVLLITRHIPLHDVSRAVTRTAVYQGIKIAWQALGQHFHIQNPSLGVCGLNPHAGEGGTIGTEEIRHIIPAIRKARSRGINVEGPFPADTIFYPQNSKRFDAIIAMYHDQGLIPVKALCFRDLVNFTVGLPFVRTSPAHGTAFDIAGKNKADASSMSAAIRLAVDLGYVIRTA